MWKPGCRKIMSCASSSIAGLHPNMKLGYQIQSYPDLSFPIWKPVILPESLDFEDWLLLILLQANSPSWQSVNNKQLLDSLLSPDASPDSSSHRGSRSINQSCSQILKYHHLKTHPVFNLAGKSSRDREIPAGHYGGVLLIYPTGDSTWRGEIHLWHSSFIMSSMKVAAGWRWWEREEEAKPFSFKQLLVGKQQSGAAFLQRSPLLAGCLWPTSLFAESLRKTKESVFNNNMTANWWHLSNIPAVTSIPWVYN